jgi:tetratricopeptide (TPR) repeat protein
MRVTLVVSMLLGACGAGRAVAPPPVTPVAPVASAAQTVELEPMRVDVVETPHGQEAHAYDARSLLDEGNEALMLHKWDDALAAYDHLLADFPDSRLIWPALWNAGQALEGKEDWAGAASRYRRIVNEAPDVPDTKEDRRNAHFRLAAVLAESGQYAESGHTLERVLAWDDLEPEPRVEALARLGFSLLETKDYGGAEEVLRSAIAFYQDKAAAVRFESPYYVAMAQFYLGEIPHLQFLDIPLRYPEEQMRRDVEQKSQLFLLARDRYVKTVDFKSPYWATAAVFQVATIYKEFWDQWMAVPIPGDFNPDEAREYTKQVNEQSDLRKLLEKSLFFHEKNIAMAKNARVDTAWSRQSETDAEVVRELIARQQRGDYVLPGLRSGLTPKSISPDSASAPQRDVYIPPRFDL